MGVASSRAFKIGAAKQPTMLPLIDLCNHSFTPNCRLETSADGTVRLIASTDIPAADAIFINYGPLSNTSLLQDYGFIVHSNPHDAVDMQVSVDNIQVCASSNDCLVRYYLGLIMLAFIPKIHPNRQHIHALKLALDSSRCSSPSGVIFLQGVHKCHHLTWLAGCTSARRAQHYQASRLSGSRRCWRQ